MNLHLSQRSSDVGAGLYSASRLERPQIFVIRPPSRPILLGAESVASSWAASRLRLELELEVFAWHEERP